MCTCRWWQADADACHHAYVRVERTVTYLEMTSPDELRPSDSAPDAVSMDSVGKSSPAIPATYHRIGSPYHWSRVAWSDEEWQKYLSRPHLHHWIATVDGETAGMVEIEAQAGGNVEITVFGLVPEFVGKGFGGTVLTRGTELAWHAEPVGAACVTRVWLHTSSLDHPQALPNYLARGFHQFRTETRERELPA